MRKYYIIFFAILFFILSSAVKAEITVKDYMSLEFLSKQGYSDAMLHSVEVTKAKTFGEELPKPQYKNKWQEYYKKGSLYIDPSDDDGEFGMHKIQIDARPWISDL